WRVEHEVLRAKRGRELQTTIEQTDLILREERMAALGHVNERFACWRDIERVVDEPLALELITGGDEVGAPQLKICARVQGLRAPFEFVARVAEGAKVGRAAGAVAKRAVGQVALIRDRVTELVGRALGENERTAKEACGAREVWIVGRRDERGRASVQLLGRRAGLEASEFGA